jgi:hypothetical protein
MKLINIIFDSRRIEKYDPLIAELKRQGLIEDDYEIWPCLLLNTVVESINASHKMIVRKAKEEGLKEVCIAEDDLEFTSSNSWSFFIKNKPEIYDLYLACTYGDRMTKQVVGFHLYCVHEQFYDDFLSVPEDKHIDTAMWFTKGQDFHFCYPYPALQRPGFSANNKSHQDYNSILKPEDIYYGI